MTQASSQHNNSSEPIKTVVITGAGSGFGRELAHRYAQAGWCVGITDVDEQRAQETFELVGGHSGGHFAMQHDVRDETQWQAVRTRVLEAWGRLGVLINNAGVAAGGRLEETPLDDWQWIMDIDLMGVMKGCHTFVGLLREQKQGHIVNIASFAGLAGAPHIAAYGTAKAGVVALSEILRAELHDDNVGVSVVCPAFVKTNLLDTFRSPEAKLKGRVQSWMDKANVSAQDVAQQIFTAVERRQFLVLTHKETRWMWRLKRWFPEFYFKVLLRGARGKGGAQK
ncbi:MAG: SDR family oxidoreductase [Xanthomonadales bacterium]|nr:SDR family oxidoreductase [Xanthomonadales bacterium]